MEFSTTPAQQSLRNEIVEFAKRELNDGVRQREQTAEFDRVAWLKCAEQKLQGLAAPPEFGGCGLDSLSTAMALESLGYGCVDGGLVFAVAAHLLAVVVPIWKHGSDQQRCEYLPRLCDGSWVGANAMTEPNSGSDVASISTVATPEANGFRLTGVKGANNECVNRRCGCRVCRHRSSERLSWRIDSVHRRDVHSGRPPFGGHADAKCTILQRGRSALRWSVCTHCSCARGYWRRVSGIWHRNELGAYMPVCGSCRWPGTAP